MTTWEIYRAGVGGLNWEGKPLPRRVTELGPRQVSGWRRVAAAKTREASDRAARVMTLAAVLAAVFWVSALLMILFG